MIADDIGAAFQGLVGWAFRLVIVPYHLGRALFGLATGNWGLAAEGAGDVLKARVPGYGNFAAPNWPGGSILPAFPNQVDQGAVQLNGIADVGSAIYQGLSSLPFPLGLVLGDAFAFVFANTVGKLLTLGHNLLFGFAYHRVLSTLLQIPVDLLLPGYGFYSGSTWGLGVWGDVAPPPMGLLDGAAAIHDDEYLHAAWIRNVWSFSRDALPPGPLGLVYQSVGTPLFAAGALTQQFGTDSQ